MENDFSNVICQDVLGLIYKQLPFHVKNMMLTCKYFYETYKLIKKNYSVGNYILTSIQLRMVDDMINHINNSLNKSLIIQSNLSTGKTAACLAFALSKYKGTTVIIVPLSIMPQWYNEIVKMYGSLGKVAIVNENYMSNTEMKKIRYNQYNPKTFGYKVLILSHHAKYDIISLGEHSVIMIDEVHKKLRGHNHPKLIGITASKAVNWLNANYKMYSEEERLPSIISDDIISHNIDDTIEEIKKVAPGPYLILCSNTYKSNIKSKYVEYGRTIDSLSKMNQLENHESALLCPERDSTGINLTQIKSVIFVYPTQHINETVIQAIGRVTRATSRHDHILLYNLHEHYEEIILHRSTLSENEITEFCKENQLSILKHIRNKYKIIELIRKLIKATSYHQVYKLPPIYITLVARIPKKDFDFIEDALFPLLMISNKQLSDILKNV